MKQQLLPCPFPLQATDSGGGGEEEDQLTILREKGTQLRQPWTWDSYWPHRHKEGMVGFIWVP